MPVHKVQRHEWTVTLSNDRQGFRKTRTVDAVRITEAVALANEELRREGYDPAAFVAIFAERGREAPNPERITWYDSSDGANRRRALELDAGTLYFRQREHPADTWPAPLVTEGVTFEDAAAMAAKHELHYSETA